MVSKKIETEFRDQGRWNDVIGREGLAQVDQDPRSFTMSQFKFNARVKDMLGRLDDVQGKSILELGCGKGMISVVLAGRGAQTTGIDIGPDLIVLAKELARINKVECDFQVSSVDSLPFPDESFDHVVGSAIMHHLPRQAVQTSIAEAFRVLRPGGTLMLSEPIENSRIFEFLQNLVPVGTPGRPNHRPSLLQREKWREFLKNADDRAMRNSEFTDAAKPFASIEFTYYGMLSRLGRIIRVPSVRSALGFVDKFLTHDFSPIKKLSQSVLVTFCKA